MSAPGILGIKLGMTQIFSGAGDVIPATVIKAGPCVVVQKKTRDKDGYDAVQLGLVEFIKPQRVNKPMTGHFKKAGAAPGRFLRELRTEPGGETKVGEKVLVDQFRVGDKVSVTGISKGKGFAGGVKRHHYRGGGKTHGSMFHRAPGSIGASSYPSRVWPGARMPGHLGAERVTVRNLEVVQVDTEENLLLVRGAVPGAVGRYVVVRKAKQ
jgi:large subunit ribosomal protein L3